MSLCGVDVGVEDDILVGDVWIEVFSAGRLQGSAMSKVDCTDVSGASVMEIQVRAGYIVRVAV